VTELPATPSRDAALDATRTFAIWLMVACHSARLISKRHRPDWMQFAMEIEPLCQALFMAMVGVSLVYSVRIATARGEKGWGLRQLKRAGQIFGIGFLLFFFEKGWQWPWTITSNGILGAIAESMVLFLPLAVLAQRRPAAGLWAGVALTAGLFGATYALDVADIHLLVLNAGNGALMPYAVLTGFGFIAACVLLDRGRVAKGLLLATVGIAGALSVWHYGFMPIFDHPIGRVSTPAVYQVAGSGPEQVWKLLTHQPLKADATSYYNFRPALIPLLMALCAGIYTLARLPGKEMERLRPLWLVGRQSLGVYLLHLILIAITVVAVGKNRALNEPWLVTTGFCVILGACYLYAFMKERRTAQRRTQKASTAGLKGTDGT
jgi:hypothetical protein